WSSDVCSSDLDSFWKQQIVFNFGMDDQFFFEVLQFVIQHLHRYRNGGRQFVIGRQASDAFHLIIMGLVPHSKVADGRAVQQFDGVCDIIFPSFDLVQQVDPST